MNDQAKGIAHMTLAMTLSGTIGWFVLVSGQPAWDVVFWRCVFAIVALAGYCAWKGAFRHRLSRREWLIAVLGGFAIVINWLLLFQSYRFASVSLSTAIYNLQPFMLLGFGVVLFGERITRSRIGWLCLAFAGLLLVVAEKPSASYVETNYALGIALAIGAAFGWAVAAASTKRLASVPPQLVALVHVCVGFLMLLPVVRWDALPEGGTTWTMLVTLGLVHTGFVYVLLYSAVQRLPTYLQGTLTFINPIVAVLTDVFALVHVVKPIQLGGIAMILLAACGMAVGPAIARKVLVRADR